MGDGAVNVPRPQSVPIGSAHGRLDDNVRRLVAQPRRLTELDDVGVQVGGVPPVAGDSIKYDAASGGFLFGPSGSPWATAIVVASNAKNHAVYAAMALAANYIFLCTGTADELVVQAAVDWCPSAANGGGLVLLTEGDFTFSGSPPAHTGYETNNVYVFSTTNTIQIRGMAAGYDSGTRILIPATMTVDCTGFDGFWLVEGFVIEIAATPAHQVYPVANCTFAERVIAIYNGGCGSGSLAFNVVGSPCGINRCQVFGGTSNLNQAFEIDPGSVGTIEDCYADVSCSIAAIFLNGDPGTKAVNNIIKTTSGGAGSAGILVKNTDNICENNTIIANAITDVIAVQGTRPTVRGNTIRKGATINTNGIKVYAGTIGAEVVHNDLRGPVATNQYVDAGAGTFKNLDGSANNWNLL